MSLSKQLYIIVSLIFFMIFTGNFIISVKNTKEYLEIESITKAQDTATSIGMSLKNLLHDKKDPEIESIINAIANRGFYREIRLEDAYFTISGKEFLRSIPDIDLSSSKLLDVNVDKKYGELDKVTSDSEIANELSQLENNPQTKSEVLSNNMSNYTFSPTELYKNGGKIDFDINYLNSNNEKKSVKTTLNVTKTLVQVTRSIKFDEVPNWFISMIPIKLAEQSSEINDGWKTTAVIYVSANPGDAYAKLYEQAKNAIIYAFVAFLISIAILFVFVQYILKPLKNIEKLANNIAVGKFDTIKELPHTTEIKAVAIAMNDMSSKIETIIEKLNNNLENITTKLSKDSVTNLPLKQSFETDMKNMFIGKISGYIYSIKIFDLASFAKSHTNNEVNDFIEKFATILKDTKMENPELKTSAYRFFGSEFAIIGQNFSYEDAQNFAKKLQLEFEKLAIEFNKNDIVHIGATPLNPIGTIPEIIQSANEACEKANIIGPNEFYIADTVKLSRDMESWKELVIDIIDNGKFDIKYIGDSRVLNFQFSDIIMQEAFATIRDKNNEEIPIGTFVSIAEKYEKIVEFDKKVVSKVINHILLNNVRYDISINLSIESINNTAFIAWLKKMILEHRDISKQLIFSATAYAVAKDVDKFKYFADEIHECGSKIIIKRFESKFIPLGSIKDFNLDYIRLARDYTQDICRDNSKQSFVEAIQELATLLNIKVFAESVKNDEDLETIKKFNLYAASR